MYCILRTCVCLMSLQLRLACACGCLCVSSQIKSVFHSDRRLKTSQGRVSVSPVHTRCLTVSGNENDTESNYITPQQY